MFRLDGHELVAVIEDLQARGKALGRLMPTAAEILVAGVHDVYEAEGPGWEPLKKSTLKKRRGGGGHKILQDTGVMASSTHPAHGADWAEAYAGDKKAEIHAAGAPSKNIPVRNPFNLGPFENPVMDEIAELLAIEATK